MQILTLNTWGGRAGRDDVLAFFRKHADIDIFCLQEIWSAPYDQYEGVSAGGKVIQQETIMTQGLQDLTAALPNHQAFFRPHFLDNYGLCMFVRRDLEVVEEGELFVYQEKGHIPEGDIGNHARNIQFVTIRTETGLVTIINFHGLWNGKGKGDCEERLAQTEKILGFLASLDHPYILCGDFNLLPETESLKRFELAGLRNLIKEFGITSTRTALYTKPEKYADYIFVSPGVTVTGFSVLPDQVSDHAPLLLEIV
ncbi:MAG TPA: endonuclease/exonuclease/phosphatase family protein [Candidatus Paceibacterota bacterium]|nr:endonuclease/exonuclease/phosphatase family protein [Candidatus Paceibacterota bacterium]